jgi:hypothetical protein
MSCKGRAKYPTDRAQEQWDIERFAEVLTDGLAVLGFDRCPAGIASGSSKAGRWRRPAPECSTRRE